MHPVFTLPGSGLPIMKSNLPLSPSAGCRRLLFCTLGILLLGQVAVAAPPGPDGNRGHLYRLLNNPQVHTYLGLSAEQAAAAGQASARVVEDHREAFAHALAPETKAERVPLVARVFVSVTDATFKASEAMMSPYQLARLRQIEVQTFGLRSLGRPAVVEHLGLTPDQQARFRLHAEEAGEIMKQLVQNRTLSAAERQARSAAVQRRNQEVIAEVLTIEQRVKWDLLVGASFVLSRDGR